MEKQNTINTTLEGGSNMDILNRIKENDAIIKDLVSEEAYRNFLVVKNALGEELALTTLKNKYPQLFETKKVAENVLSSKAKEEDEPKKAIKELKKELKVIKEKILPSKNQYTIDNRNIGLAYVAYKVNNNSEVGHESNKAHIYQMVKGKARTLLLEEAGFESGSAKYISPIKRSEMKLIINFKGHAKEEILEVAHTSNALISKVQDRINGCDLTDEENLRVIFEDIDYLHRTSIELVIDACKKGYNVTKGFEFLKGYVRLFSMMVVMSNMEEVLQQAIDYRMGRINAEDFGFMLYHDEVGVVDDIENAKAIRTTTSNGKEMVIVPDRMYILQREVVKVFQPYCDMIIKTLFSPENKTLDSYDDDILRMAAQEPEINDVVEIVKDPFSIYSRHQVKKISELDENSNNYEVEKAYLSTEYRIFLDHLKNFLYRLLDGKSIEDKANIVKAASICNLQRRGGETIKEIKDTKISSMPLNVCPELEIARNLVKEKVLGHTVNTGLKIHGRGCSDLQEGDQLVFENGVITKIIRDGEEMKNKHGIVVELMSNKNDFYDTDDEDSTIEDYTPDHRLYTGTLEYYKDSEGRHWAKKVMELDDIKMPTPNENELFVRVRRTYDIDEVIERGKRCTFNYLEDGYKFLRDYFKENPDMTIELRAKYVEDKEYVQVPVYNAIIAIDNSGEEKLLGSYACESEACQKLYDGAYGHVIYSKYLAVEKLQKGNSNSGDYREAFYFVIETEGTSNNRTTVDTVSESSEENDSLLSKIKNMSLNMKSLEDKSSNEAEAVEEVTEDKSEDKKASNSTGSIPSLDNIVRKSLADKKGKSNKAKPAETAPKAEPKEEQKGDKKGNGSSLSDLLGDFDMDNLTVKSLGNKKKKTVETEEAVDMDVEEVEEVEEASEDDTEKGAEGVTEDSLLDLTKDLLGKLK